MQLTDYKNYDTIYPMENIDLGAILIVGSGVSLLQQFVKARSWSSLAKKALVVTLSLASAGIYIMFKETAFWATFVGVLLTASTVYAMVIKDLFPVE